MSRQAKNQRTSDELEHYRNGERLSTRANRIYRRPMRYRPELNIVVVMFLAATCTKQEAIPRAMGDCPNLLPKQGDACPAAGLSCSYFQPELPGCKSYFTAKCLTELRWQYEGKCDGAGGGSTSAMSSTGQGGQGGVASGGSGGTAGNAGAGGNASVGGSAGAMGVGGSTTASGAGGSGGSSLTCDDQADPKCSDPKTCVCVGCKTDGGCGDDDDCVCPDCKSICTDCDNNGVCSPFTEGCSCKDCKLHALCN
jgi:hypothetical protein